MKIKKLKKAAIYDRWLNTLGGGEQVAFAYAQTLRDMGYETCLLTHSLFDMKRAEQKMGVNLAKIKVVVLPLMSGNQLSKYTEDYDVFVNTSYLDFFPNRSKFGILSIFFPIEIRLSMYEYLKRAVVLPSFTHFFIYPSQFQGFSYDEYKDKKILKWLGDKSSIEFNQDVSTLSVTILFKTMTISAVDQLSFELDKKQIFATRIMINHNNNQVTYYFNLGKNPHKKFSIIRPANIYAKELALVKLTIPSFKYGLYNLFKNYFPKWEMRLHGGPGVTKLSDFTSYQKLITISDFSNKWIKNYWGIKGDVLYPPVSVDDFYSSNRKNNWIVHVGRFFVTGHNKKQLELIKVFRKMVDEKGLKDWELHFIGSIEEGIKHEEYFKQCQYFAKRYPIKFHLNVPFSVLKEILSKSKIYWHATGMDEDEKNNPIVFEHFGITTVEAMSSGCVPVVIGAGGQTEIVTPDAGYLWHSREELIAQTLSLTNNPKELRQKSKNARQRAMYFDRKMFKLRLQAMLKTSLR